MTFDILVLILFITTYSFVYGQQQETSINVPNIFVEADQNKWLVIKSKQITKLLQTHPKESSWLVEDHYHFSRGISYSLYTNERNKNETYSSISHHSKIYYATSNDGDWLSDKLDCRLDHRQDHRTLFPWKYTKLTRTNNNNDKPQVEEDEAEKVETNKLEPYETILGFGALWLNLIENKVNCSIVGQQPSQQLNCKFDDQKQFIRLSFRWPIERFNGLVMPKSAQLYRSPIVHLDGYKVIQHVTIDVLDISVTNFESLNSEERIKNVLDVCKASINKKEVQFPSLIKSIDKSYRQTYRLSYSIKLYDLNEEKTHPLIDSNKAVVNQELSYEEWFSNRREEQTIVRRDKKGESDSEMEKFYSLFKYRMPNTKRNIIYKTKFYPKQPPSICELMDEDESEFFKFFSISHLFTRKIHFEFAEDNKDPETKKNIHHHSGYLIGFGALLMNAADIQNKKLVPSISKTNQPIIESKWHSQLEWIVDDIESAYRFHFFFRSHSMEEHQLEVDDLTKVEVRQLVERNYQNNDQNNDKDEIEIESPNNGLDEDEELEKGDYLDLIVMSIDLLDFSTSLYQDQINFAFNLPEICNFSEENFEENIDTEEDEKENDSKKTDSDVNEANDEAFYEFPHFEQFLQLARDYIIHSEWNFDDGTFIKVIEYLMINLNDQNEDELLTRLDVTRAVNELDIMEEYSIYLRYSENILIRYEGEKCNHVSQLDDWLEVLASDKVYGDHCKTLEDYFDGKPPLKFYSLGALWKLASESNYIQFLGKFSGKNDPDQSNQKLKLDYGLWFLEEDKNIPHLSLLFKFYFLDLNQVDFHKRLKLASIQIDTSHRLDVTTFKTVNSIKIENILIETNAATMLYFMLPSNCDTLIDQAERERAQNEPEFPSLNKYMDALSETSKDDYEFRYNLIMSYINDTSSYQIKAIESKELMSLFIGEQKWRIWSRFENKTLIEQVSSGLCKPSKDLISLFNLQDFIDVISSNFVHIKQQQQIVSASLLGRLWNLIGLRVKQEQKSSIETGARLKVIAHAKYEHQHLNSHQKLVEWSILDNSRQISISITFEHLNPKENESILYSLVLLSPNYTLRFMNQYNPRRSNINYVSLPEACFKLVSNDRFPKVGSHEDNMTNETIHLRSEIVSTSPFEGGNMMLILDEWLKPSDGSYRSQSRSLKTGDWRDFLIYTRTEESFDLSTNFKCFTKDHDHPTDGSKRDKLPVNVQPVENFIVKELLIMVGNNGGAFYHPLALWFLAEQSEVKRTLIEKNEQLDFKDFLTDLSKINNWLYTEQWHIEHNEYRSLSYTLKFNTKFDSQKRKFLMVLSNLDTMNWRQDIAIEVVNYKYMHHNTDNMDQFLIPKGRGCKRNDKAKETFLAGQVDVLVLERLNPIQFDYSASLETLEDNQDGNSIQLLSPRPMFHSGWFGKCPPSWTLEPVCALKVHHERRHYFNGTVKSQRSVISGEHFDPFIVQVRSLDENSGYCSVRVEKQSANNHLLNLDFNVDGFNEIDLIQINDLPFFDLITLKLPEYELIQWQHIEGGKDFESDVVKLVYELRLSNFSLNPQLSGETSLIRTLERRADLKPVGNYFYHSSAKLEAIIESKAKFTINIENLGYKECLSTLSRSKTEECYQSSEFYQSDPLHQDDVVQFHRRLRTFHLIYYPIDNDLNGNVDSPPREYKEMSESIFEKMKLEIERSFVDSFLRLPVELSPTQLGKVQVNFRNEDKTIHILFNMMEPPSALEYFAELKNKRMKPSSTLLSPIKVLNSKYSCSNWCDIEHCSAFSYCSDRSCQILILDIDDTSCLMKNDPGELNQKINLLDDDSCSYYKAPIYQTKANLNSVIGFIRNAVLPIEPQNDTEHLKDQLKFVLFPPNSKARIEFVARDLVEVLDDDIETTLEKAKTSEMELETYSILRERFQISGYKLENQPKDERILVKYHLIQANNLAVCFSECSILDCQLLSYCNTARICILLTNISSSQDFQSVLNENSEQNGDCSIYGRNFLDKYQRFADTRKPRLWKNSISDISLLECASICEFETSIRSIKQQEAANFDCLSFDYCLITNRNPDNEMYTCFIQDMHIIMDDFDDNIMINKPTKNDSYQANQADCSHYSKSLLADFSQYSNKVFSSHNSIIFRGIDLEKCTLICRRDEVCLGFEYCGFDLSCFILRKQDNVEQDFDAFNQLVDEVPYKKCRVFKLKHIEEEFRIQFSMKDSVIYHHIERADKFKTETWLEETFVLLSISLIALVFGAIFHLSIVILTGKKLQLKPPFITGQ